MLMESAVHLSGKFFCHFAIHNGFPLARLVMGTTIRLVLMKWACASSGIFVGLFYYVVKYNLAKDWFLHPLLSRMHSYFIHWLGAVQWCWSNFVSCFPLVLPCQDLLGCSILSRTLVCNSLSIKWHSNLHHLRFQTKVTQSNTTRTHVWTLEML